MAEDKKSPAPISDELIYCVKCGSPEYLKPESVWGATPIVERVNEDQEGWTRYWVKCFHCGGKQPYDHPSADLVKAPAPDPKGEDLLASPVKDVKALANSGASLTSS